MTEDGEYTDRYIFAQITHIETFMQREDYVVLSFKVIGADK